MDWISAIQQAINYVEDNLSEKIDYEIVAKKAYSSEFYFGRLFSMLCGFSIVDYARMRRLSLAGEELYNSNKKVIDIALKYGYDTPESFSRAFTKFHGVTPIEVKHGKKAKTFSKLYVKLILSGGNKMDYKIEKLGKIKFVLKKTMVNKPQGDTATADISAFWQKFNQERTMERLSKYSKFDTLKGLLGICFSGEMKNGGFPYGIGTEYNGVPLTDDEFEIVEIPAYTYAVFECRGAMPDAFKDTYKRICSEFFVESNYQYGNGVEIEVYPSDDATNPDYYCEIWIAVKEK